MGQEHAPETVWQAQELYCSDRLSFVRVAEITGVADSTLRRWADTYGWREKREEIAKAEADIRADKVLARAKTIKTLLDKPRADLAFAVSALEQLALKEAELARLEDVQNAQAGAMIPAVTTLAEAIPLLRKTAEQKLSVLLTRPENLDTKAIQGVKDCFLLIADIEARLPKTEDTGDTQKGITADLHERLVEALTGGV